MKHAIVLNFFKKYKEGDIIKINPAEIQKIPELQNVFRIDLDVKNRIKDDMRINGFSKAHPVHIFKWSIDGKEAFVLCDGYTRFTAAKELELDFIYAQIHNFKSIDEAVLYSMKEQFNRRNCQDSELLKTYELLRQQEIDGHKLTAAEMSERLQKSKRHIFKLQEVFSKSTKEQLNKIRNGEASINQVYNEIKKQEIKETEKHDEELLKAEKKQTEIGAANLIEDPTETELEQTVQPETNEVNLPECQSEITNQITIKEDIQTNQQKLPANADVAKRKDTSFSKHLSDKQILLIGAKYALIEKAKGKSVAEILDTNAFPDSVKATDITFDDTVIDILEAM